MPDFGRLSILVADSNRHMRALLRTMLAGLGFKQLFDAADLDGAVTILKDQSPDILLTDWVGVDSRSAGEDLVRHVRDPQNGAFAALPVIMVSAHSEAFRVRRALQLGVDDYIRKPVSAGVLQQRISRVLARPPAPVMPAATEQVPCAPEAPEHSDNTFLI